jgi:hypothetical protein
MEKLTLRAGAGLLRRRPGRPEPLRRNFGPRDAGRTSTIAASAMSGRQGKLRALLPRHTLELSSRRNFGPVTPAGVPASPGFDEEQAEAILR